jgi:hypothetical protein
VLLNRGSGRAAADETLVQRVSRVELALDLG